MIARFALACLLAAFATLAHAQPTPPPAAPPPVVTRDALGEEVTLSARTLLFKKGSADWEEAWEKVREAFKAVRAEADRLKLKVTGAPLLINRASDDDGFEFEAALPIEAAPSGAPGSDFEVGPAPAGKMLKFVHRGALDTMENTYEMIGNYLDAKGLEIEESSIEEFVTDPLTAKPDALTINVYVPVKAK